MKKFSLLALTLIALIPGCGPKKCCKTECPTEVTTTVVEVTNEERFSGADNFSAEDLK